MQTRDFDGPQDQSLLSQHRFDGDKRHLLFRTPPPRLVLLQEKCESSREKTRVGDVSVKVIHEAQMHTQLGHVPWGLNGHYCRHLGVVDVLEVEIMCNI